MIPTNVPNGLITDSFRCTRIVFDDSDLVSLHTACRINQSVREVVLLFTFSLFNELLRFSGKSGEALQLAVSDKLWNKEETPYVIEFPENAPVFTTCQLRLSELVCGDYTCFSVDDLKPLSFVQRAKKMRSDIADFGYAGLEQHEIMNQALLKAAAMYRYYNGLMELNISEASAREKAGLKNETLFKIASQAAKSLSK